MKQAATLSRCFPAYADKFTGIYASDLSRAHDTGKLALSQTHAQKIVLEKNLRECDFGDDEKKVYTTLSEEEKKLLNSMDYKAPNGESWVDVYHRAVKFMSTLESRGNYAFFTHGGLMQTLTWEIGLKYCLPNASVAAIQLDQSNSKPKKILFLWEFGFD